MKNFAGSQTPRDPIFVSDCFGFDHYEHKITDALIAVESVFYDCDDDIEYELSLVCPDSEGEE